MCKVPREPAGFHSVCGTEQDLTDAPKVGIPQLVHRSKCEDHRFDYAPLVRDGARYGKQYAVWRSEQTCVKYLVRYQRRRMRAPPAAHHPPAVDSQAVGNELGGGGEPDHSERPRTAPNAAEAEAKARERGGVRGGVRGGERGGVRGGERGGERQASESPLFSVGLIADVQYADVVDGTSHDGHSRRYYRRYVSK